MHGFFRPLWPPHLLRARRSAFSYFRSDERLPRVAASPNATYP